LRPLGAFLDGVNAAVVGAIAATSILLLQAAVFNLAQPVWSLTMGAFTIDIPALLLFAASAVLLLRRSAPNSTWLVGGGAVVGLLLQWSAGVY